MTIGFASRAAASTCALCTAGLLTLAPAAASAGTRTDPAPSPGSGARTATGTRAASAAAPDALLYRSGTQVRPRAGAPVVPALSARSWLVADAGSGAVLAAHDAHRRLPPASTIKTLFALTLLPVLPVGIRHTVSEEELTGIGPGSSRVGVAENLTYRISDLWNGVFLSSGNDAVRVLASLNGGWKVTAERMQDKAHALGAHDTRVKSPDGYDAPGQVSSAFDLAVFGRAGLQNPDFVRYCSREEAVFPGRDDGSYAIRNTNRLLTGSDGVERYPGIVGIKNGYTSGAGHTLVAAARRDGRSLVVTVLNPRRGGAHAVYEEARTLLDWGFEASGRVDAVGSLDALRGASLPGSPAQPAAAPALTTVPAARDDGPERTVVWTVSGTALLGAVGTGLFLRLRWGPAVAD
ncbi:MULTISPECIES: D-alanyl-D-alanine carboxypeptidase family protein [unclassified Streptomyces]|uniref:D-alanyl-D-alanine carboxypeptidase family protein n=1 Tax=unclassified Streptomyces TaxID=2593676 RepID=UPI00073BBD0B|nr:D-alanyl-D-alanine carboxypeptidase [Streptomyces sp. AVP053U2]ODA75174.1 D-alanyl-D-alanine carboxypeptidase DacD precursor [Streptomyces sp. AVP053U2]